MRLLPLIVLFILFGCISLGERTEENVTENITEANETEEIPPPPQWERYNATYFSFDYPASMEAKGGAADFIATRDVNGMNMETMVVAYLDTVETYGENKDKIFKERPSQAASELLYADIKDDFLVLLSDAETVGNVSTYSIARDAHAAEVPFTIKQDSFTYSGYAIDLYIPEKSVHAKIRMISFYPEKAKAMRDQFLLSFRIE